MKIVSSETYPLRAEIDIVNLRQATRSACNLCKFSLVDQTKLVTAASELARNAVVYGGGGTARLEQVSNGVRVGVRLVFEDHGPGISDIERAMSDGYTSGTGLGLGLGGSRRLVNEFDIQSMLGKGTTVTIARWK